MNKEISIETASKILNFVKTSIEKRKDVYQIGYSHDYPAEMERELENEAVFEFFFTIYPTDQAEEDAKNDDQGNGLGVGVKIYDWLDEQGLLDIGTSHSFPGGFTWSFSVKA